MFTCVFGARLLPVLSVPKLQALVYDIIPSTTAVFSYAIGPRKLSANEQIFGGRCRKAMLGVRMQFRALCLIIIKISPIFEDIKPHIIISLERARARIENATLKLRATVSSIKAQELCKVEVAVLGSQSLKVLVVSVDVKQH